jgi:hypothetical protein
MYLKRTLSFCGVRDFRLLSSPEELTERSAGCDGDERHERRTAGIDWYRIDWLE